MDYSWSMKASSKILLSTFAFLLSASYLYAETKPSSYIVVGVSGFGTRTPDRAWQPSGAHDNLPEVSAVEKTYRLVHYAKKNEVSEVLENFRCSKGKQNAKDLGLVVMINSWGSNVGYQLVKRYESECGRKADYVVMVDGVSKPIGAFSKKIPAQRCLNYYQTKGFIHGKALEGCENKNLTQDCDDMGLSPVKCHIYVEWDGTSSARRLLERLL